MAKIYRAIQTKLSQIVHENIHIITDLPADRAITVTEFLPIIYIGNI